MLFGATTLPASRASGERRSCPVLTTAALEASRASGERRSVLAALAAGTTAVAETAASVAMVLRVLRLIEPSSVSEPPGAARRRWSPRPAGKRSPPRSGKAPAPRGKRPPFPNGAWRAGPPHPTPPPPDSHG